MLLLQSQITFCIKMNHYVSVDMDIKGQGCSGTDSVTEKLLQMSRRA